MVALENMEKEREGTTILMVVPAAVLAVAAVGGSCGPSFAGLRIQKMELTLEVDHSSLAKPDPFS